MSTHRVPVKLQLLTETNLRACQKVSHTRNTDQTKGPPTRVSCFQQQPEPLRKGQTLEKLIYTPSKDSPK